MKFLNIIFPIYLIILSMMPCADLEVGGHNEGINMETSAQTEGDHEGQEDFCAPFCICSCCGSCITITYPQIFSLKSIEIFEKKNVILNHPAFSNFNHTIWQPPKI